MSYIDQQMVLSTAVTLTTGTVSTSAYQLGVAPDGTVADPTKGDALCVVFNVLTDATFNDADETYQFQALADNLATLADVPAVLVESKAFLGSTLTAGTRVVLTLPSGSLELAQKAQNIADPTKILKFLGSKVIPANTTPSITFNAQIQPLSQVQAEAQFAKNYIIL